MTTDRLYLGVDGGGTKTALALTELDGTVLAESRTASSYYFDTGIDAVAEVIRDGVQEICAQVGAGPDMIDFAFFGLPGYGESSVDQPRLDAIGETVLGHQRYRCGNDMICGWAGSLGAVDGINVVSGTGSICYGEREGVGARVGGWGELFSDEGSAYWVGIQGLNVASQMSDGRRLAGPLLELVRDRLELATDLDLVDVVLNRWKGDRGRIAELSTLVDQAASAGDHDAVEVLELGGRQLAELAATTRARLGWPEGSTIPVSYSGGTFGSVGLRTSFTTRLAEDGRQAGITYDLREPAQSPHVGAALYAARLANVGGGR